MTATAGALVLVTAAGASRRMGTCKALLELDGVCAFEWIARAAHAANPAARVVLVTGADDAAIRARAARSSERVECLHNPAWSLGRAGGIALAQQRFAGQDALVWPVDCPRVGAAAIRALCERWSELGAPARGWLAPAIVSGGRMRHGHPIWIGRELLSELGALDPDTPLSALRARAAPLAALETDDARVLEDFDAVADLPGTGAR
jgi:CTP:molybdopterin cytidylyltransferase MocA